MNISGNTILITGGATGIGFALAEAFVKNNNEVIVCARTDKNLQLAQQKIPQLHIKICDLSKEEEIASLYKWTTTKFPAVNILVNNAGIQRMIDFKKGMEDIQNYRTLDGEDELSINLKAYLYTAAYFTPYLMQKKHAAIINVGSGLGFIPMSIVPIYCATKAAVHSFSLSLRHQLRTTSVKVFEIIPPTVDTNLDKGARAQRRQHDRGIAASEVAKAALDGIEKDNVEIAIGMAQNIQKGALTNFDQIFQRMNP